MRITSGLALLVLTCVSTGCGSNAPVSPTRPTTTTTVTASPAVVSVAIGANVTLTRIGETSQLTAIATFADHSTKDVTSDGKWTWGDSRVAAINPGGLLTIVGYGSTWISFLYQGRGAGVSVTATPTGTFVLAGRVREPGAGGLANISVLDTMSGRSATTDADGNFSLAQLARQQAHFRVDISGYEPAEGDATSTDFDLPVQHIVRLMAGETVTPAALAPNDLRYTVNGSNCQPCRLIRVVVPGAGTVHVHVTWSLYSANVGLFVDDQLFAGAIRDLTADVPVNAPREVLMYLGGMPDTANGVIDHMPFTFATSIR